MGDIPVIEMVIGWGMVYGIVSTRLDLLLWRVDFWWFLVVEGEILGI